MTKYDSVAGLWQEVDGSGGDQWALDLQSDGGYFYIKTGEIKLVDGSGNNVNLSASVPEHFLYANNSSSNWAVVSFDEIIYSINVYLAQITELDITVKSLEIDKFSHLGELGGTPIPEPASMLLFGVGIAGLAGLRKRNRES